MNVVKRVADGKSVHSFQLGVIAAIAGLVASNPLCLGLAAYAVASWPLAKRFLAVAWTGHYPK